MTFSPRRLVVSFAALVATLLCPAMMLGQTQAIVGSALPEEPRPQIEVTVPATLVAESYSSSVFDTALDAIQSQSQVQPTPPQADKPLTDEEKKKAADEELKRELHQRMGGVVPNFNAVLDGSTVPLSPKQKMKAAFRSAIDPYQVGLALFTSGIGQAEDSHDTFTPAGVRVGYGQGWEGYGKRFGASFTDQFDGTILGNGVFPILLKQDARYFRLGTGSFKKRFFYSLSTTVRCKSDSGKWQPNYSNLLGNLAAGGISNLYYPEADRGFGLTIQQGLSVTAEGAFGALLIEFYPDIRKHFHGKNAPAR